MTGVYAALAAAAPRLSTLTVFLLDEFGGLAPEDPARCLAMLRRDFIDLLEEPPRLHAPDIDADDPNSAASDYERLVGSGGLTLTLLGLGLNGHIGMNEPGATRDSRTRVVSLSNETIRNATTSYGARSAPRWGITLGMRDVLDSDEVWLLVTGAHKARILKDTITGPIGSEVPASFLREHPKATLFADEAAAGLL